MNLPLVDLELSEAIDFYEIQTKGLGLAFKKEIKSAIIRIKEFPTLCPVIKGDIRRYQLHKYPYKILYSLEKDYVYILAISQKTRLLGRALLTLYLKWENKITGR